ncbi:hypothetical protein [Parasphingopyxis marina]|uniref:DUF4129 domain-containing protein n=1 Tax=Parasphingopyxis marina TaxID=2761622 RepID=A0A842HWY1_9SPHN|nr:hypothetical protein [Parasphingopyxis marina]MBC2776841.1 hypothetical protein [Parasphingopyxis marina]
MTAPPAPAGNDGKQNFDQAYRELVDSDRFQTDLPRFEPPDAPEPPPDWLSNLLEWLSGTGPFWQVLFWLIAAVLVLLLLFFVGRALQRRFAGGGAAEDGEAEIDEWQPDEKTARGLLGEAEALAREGRYAEAVHLLLFRSISDIEDRLPDFLKPALTSRDISASETLPTPARSAFSSIAAIVERGIFAERPVDEKGWDEARIAYEDFAFRRSWAREGRS